ncbi:MAG TPA: YsnF/AvaK domain-containing protein [Candidatus Baltobacteraceae bacterium]|nr:YsnF/AvaK domain-containing protein [Candidatus Baltobacteraceae bacterium]
MTTYSRDPTTIYFRDVDDAESARRELVQQGIPQSAVSVQSERAGSGFMENLKQFFGASSTDGYSGGALLSVPSGSAGPELMSIVRRHGGEMQTGYSSDTSAGYGTDRGDYDTTADEQRMRLREERLSVNKRPVQEGEVRVHKEVVTENQRVDIPVQHEEVYLERRGVKDETPDDMGEIGEGDEIRIPVSREDVSVEKHPVITDEVALGKRKVVENQTVGANVRKERARVETKGNVSPKGSIDETER